ncbi:hypothetical protein AB0C19_05185 [Micromonospora sp. NPDC048842]|uniref:hypothetical protein n=1 Tax=Micromonospora sp. NPDC048842 TaxID=3154346 RepID=UPI0033DFAA45
MTTRTVNTEPLEAGSLPPDMFARAVEYVCHERNLYRVFTHSYGLRHFPLLHLDRFASWQHSAGVEPLVARYNALEPFLDRHVRQRIVTDLDHIFEVLGELFTKGHKATVNMWVTYPDGSSFVTSALLEGMDDQEVVYYTKINETTNVTCRPLARDKFLSLLDPEDGQVELDVLRHSSALAEIATMDGTDAMRRIFADLYGYRWHGDDLHLGAQKVGLDLDAFEALAADLRRSAEQILTPDGVPKQQQFRLHKHIRNRFMPIQFYLAHVRADTTLAAALMPGLLARVESVVAAMDTALGDVLKFASLLVQKPVPAMLDLHIAAILRLRDVLPAYQAVNLDVLRSITR